MDMNARCLLFVLCAAALFPSGCTGPTEGEAAASARRLAVAKLEVDVAPVTRSDIAATVELVGSLLPRRRMVVVAEVDGVILEIPASPRERIEAEVGGERISEAPRLDIGVEVAKDDLLVRLDPYEYDIKLQAAEARLEAANQAMEKLMAWHRPEEIDRLEAARDEAKAALVLAEANLRRAQPLLGRKAISQEQYDTIKAAADKAQAALKRAEADLAIARAGPTKEEIAVANAAVKLAQADVKRAEWERAKTEIHAPYDGVITDRYVDEGDRVTAMPRVEIMELSDLSLLTAQLGVPERYIGQIQVGDPAEVSVRGSAQPVPGLVVLINDKVDPTNRNFRIRVAIRNDERRFKMGQFARVALKVRSSANALTIPADAVTYAGGEARVFVYRGGRVQQRAVQLGISNDESAEVLSGLAAGEQVVTYDPSILSDGMQVQVRPATSPAQVSAASS